MRKRTKEQNKHAQRFLLSFDELYATSLSVSLYPSLSLFLSLCVSHSLSSSIARSLLVGVRHPLPASSQRLASPTPAPSLVGVTARILSLFSLW